MELGRASILKPAIISSEPGEAHHLVNHSPEELVYIIVADHHRADVTTYPKSAKCGVAPEHRFFRIADVDYFDGEE